MTELKLNQYVIMNRLTREIVECEAPSAQEACEKLGWMIGDCYVRPKRRHGTIQSKEAVHD